MKLLLPLLLAVMLAAPVAALAAPAPAWAVDPGSTVGFASSFSGGAFSGRFTRWTAAIRFDPQNLAGSSVTATIDVGSAATGDKDRDASLPSADFFDAAKYPHATFTATTFKDLGGGRYQAIGQLTLRGVSKPLTLPFTLAITGAQAKMNAAVSLNRLVFGVGQGQWSATDAIPAAVSVTINLTAHRTP
jgi:polyisoprenoid-binding protein YceI